MTAAELAALQPTAQTGAEIRAALARIAGAKISAQSRIRDAQAELDEKTRSFTLTSAHRRKVEDLVHDQQEDAEMLEVLAVQVEVPLAAVEETERDERLGAERIALRAEMASLDEKWGLEYPPLHEALEKLLVERRELVKRVNKHNEASDRILRPVELATFLIPTKEVKLLQTPEERAEASITPHEREMRAMAAMDEARRKAVAARSPIVVNDAPPKPFFTVGGVVQHSGNHTW